MIAQEKRLIEQDIKETIRLIKNLADEIIFQKYGSVFLFGTENQEEINKILDYQNKDVFTVCSSGDQYLSAVYYGAKRVDLFDIDRLTRPVTYLKIASMMSLSHEDFLNFLIPSENLVKNSLFWSPQIAKKIIPDLPEDIAYFWDVIFPMCKKEGYERFVYPKHWTSLAENIVKGMPFYANEEEYYKLQSLLRSRKYPKFIESDIFHLGEVVDDSYDIAYLSNILSSFVSLALRTYPYVTLSLKNMLEKKFVLRILKEIMPILRENGSILMDYRPNRSVEEGPDWLYNNDYFDVTSVSSKRFLEGNVNTDLVLTYKPKEKGNILDILE